MRRELKNVMAVAAVTCLVLSLAGCSAFQAVPSASPAVTSSSPAAAPEVADAGESDRPCADDIRFALDRDLGTGRSGYLVLTNAGARACTVVGFPDVAAISAGGDALTTLTHQDLNELENTPLSLAPGASGYVWIFWDDTIETMTACEQPLDAVALRVRVAGMSESTNIEADPFTVCAEGRGNGIVTGPIDAVAQAATKGI